MTLHTRLAGIPVVAVLMWSLPVPSAAQPPRPAAAATPPAEQAANEPVPLKVTIVVSRSKGDVQVSSLPFELFVNANSRASASLNMGVDVPVPSGANAYTYRRVGNNIACSSARFENGVVSLELTVEDSSIHSDAPRGAPGAVAGGVAQAPPPPPPPPPAPGMTYAIGPGPAGPIFRSFQTQTIVSMFEGKTVQFTLATDKETGETLRVSVMAVRVR